MISSETRTVDFCKAIFDRLAVNRVPSAQRPEGLKKRIRVSFGIQCPLLVHLQVIILKIVIISNGDTMLKIFPVISWWNSANSDR